MAKIWKPKEIKSIKIAAASGITITTSAALDTFFTGTTATSDNIQAYAKNVTLAVPEGAIDKIDLLGIDSSGFQNMELDEKPFDLGGISGTLVLHSVEILETFFYGTATTISTTHKRYQAGKLTTTGRPEVAILVNLNAPISGTVTNEVTVALDNAWITKLGDIKIAGPDGHFEVDFNAICLPKDFYIEYMVVS
jgi:hypothetical protein